MFSYKQLTLYAYSYFRHTPGVCQAVNMRGIHACLMVRISIKRFRFEPWPGVVSVSHSCAAFSDFFSFAQRENRGALRAAFLVT